MRYYIQLFCYPDLVNVGNSEELSIPVNILLHSLSLNLHINVDVCSLQPNCTDWSLVCLLSSQEQQNASAWYRVRLKPLMVSTTLSQRKFVRCLRAPRNLNQSAYFSRRLLLTLTASNRWDTVKSLPGHTTFLSLLLWVKPLTWNEHRWCFTSSLLKGNCCTRQYSYCHLVPVMSEVTSKWSHKDKLFHFSSI